MKNIKEIKKCVVCGNTYKVCNTEMGLLCSKHYSQFKRHGKILERTKYDLNEIEIVDDIAYIILYNNKNEISAKALIDKEDIDKVKDYKWCKDANNYVRNSKQEYLHRIIVGEASFYVDHINGNTLDNRKSNLRICNNADNLKNRVKLPKNNTSEILGVRFRKDRNKWYAEIQYNEQKVRLGSYTNKEDAIKARLDAELKYFGKYKSQVL